MNEPTTQENPITVHGGATVNGVQVDTHVIMARKGFEKWPTFSQGLDQWEAKVKAINCIDVPDVPIRNIRMHPENGYIYNSAKDMKGAVPATYTALTHLVSYVEDKPDNALKNLLDMSPRLRALRLQELLDRAPAEKRLALRTAVANGAVRVVRAIVSKLHSKEHGDDLKLIEALRSIEAPKAKLRVIRTWDSTHAEIVMPNVAIELRKDDIAYGKVDLFNSETKGGSYETNASSMRLWCLNGATMPANTAEFKVKHIGDIGSKIRTSLRVGIEAVMEHLTQLKASYTLELPKTRAETIGMFIEHHALPEDTGTALNTLWDVDGERSAGHTVAGLVNAVTRYAQTQQVDTAQKLETIAGDQLRLGLTGLV